MIDISSILKNLQNIEDQLLVEPRRDVAKSLGMDQCDIDKIRSDTIFFIHGDPRNDLPHFVKCSPLVKSGTVLIARARDLDLGSFAAFCR